MKISIVVGLVLMMLYIGTFSFWWLRSPVQTITTQSGQQVRIIKFQDDSRVYWYTQTIWIPAFWFMEHICGYGKFPTTRNTYAK
jgi:hypothetical protein